MRIDLDLHTDLPPLVPQEEIVVYRVAQEALTNVLRHANATRVRVCLVPWNGGVRLCVVDDGTGLDGAAPGAGVLGMRERAMLIGARLAMQERHDGRGVEVTLDVPAENGA